MRTLYRPSAALIIAVFALSACQRASTRHGSGDESELKGTWALSVTGFGSGDDFDVSQATFLNNPPDIASWPKTTRITEVNFRPDAMIVDFDRRLGSNRWPQHGFDPGTPPDARGEGIQYTLGICYKITGRWYCSAVVQFWQDRALTDSAAPSSFPQTWFYDAGRWGPMSSYQPQNGEMVGVFVVRANVRNIRDGSLLPRERSNVVLVPFNRGDGTPPIPEPTPPPPPTPTPPPPPGGQTGNLKVLICNPSGAFGIASAVTVRYPNGASRTLSTSDGWLDLGRVPYGSYTISASASGWQSASMSYGLSGDGIANIRLQPGSGTGTPPGPGTPPPTGSAANLKILVCNPSGAFGIASTVTVRFPDGVTETMRTTDGWLNLGSVPFGTYEISASAPGWVSGGTRFSHNVDDTANLRLQPL